ncbi:hypothetical protein GGP65_002143 [Salinibacter ruber]|nr:hypothetical protein [Salinibacter ruber]MCS3854597.1 hypothetical protein [Salinibacter ruber]MCS4097458.1 hypothetical protein [Salinibacter ruber]MCS4154152.1 hypothetical protein [Salinibacter ruber]
MVLSECIQSGGWFSFLFLDILSLTSLSGIFMVEFFQSVLKLYIRFERGLNEEADF